MENSNENNGKAVKSNKSDKGKKNDKKSKVQKKPNPFIYYPLAALVWLFNRFYLNVHYNRKAFKDMKGPAFILCSHMSNIDFLLVALELMPHRPSYIASNHFWSHPLIRWILNVNNVIPKKMFCADINAMRQILRAKESGNVIVIFPEGRLSCTGHTLSLTDGTAELVKKLGIDVYWIKEYGAYKSMPKWGKTGFRRGRIEVDGAKLFNAEDIKNLSVDEIRTGIEQAILHDDDQVLQNVSYKSKAPAQGLDGILYKCPHCGSEFRMKTTANEIFCEECGFVAGLNEKYELFTKSGFDGTEEGFIGKQVVECRKAEDAEEKKRDSEPVTESDEQVTESGKKLAETVKKWPFKRINEWYYWQAECIDLKQPLELECMLGTPDEDGNMNREAGEGVCWMNETEIGFRGTLHGEPFEFSEKISSIKGLPATVGDHFDLYNKGVMYYVIPKGDKREVIKWVQYMDRAVQKCNE